MLYPLNLMIILEKKYLRKQQNVCDFTSIRGTFIFDFSHVFLWCFFQLALCTEDLSVNPQSPRLPGREWNSLRQWFLSNMTDTLEMSTVHRASHHRCQTDRYLQAAGVSFAWFPQELASLKTFSFVSCCQTQNSSWEIEWPNHQVSSGNIQKLQNS